MKGSGLLGVGGRPCQTQQPQGSSAPGQRRGSRSVPPASSRSVLGALHPLLPSVFNDDPRSYRFLHNSLPQRPPPHPPNLPPPPNPSRLSGSSLFCMSLFLTSPAATAAVPRVQPGFLGLGGGPAARPPWQNTAGGAGSLGVAGGHSGAWEPPGPLPTPPCRGYSSFLCSYLRALACLQKQNNNTKNGTTTTTKEE